MVCLDLGSPTLKGGTWVTRQSGSATHSCIPSCRSLNGSLRRSTAICSKSGEESFRLVRHDRWDHVVWEFDLVLDFFLCFDRLLHAEGHGYFVHLVEVA